ncbi:MAG: DUF3810 domain-containing protein [Oscillospiraceae bacterium]|nr:DUF3810 domain-containing protein [Oscillospiraceae bacterium]
MKSWIKKLAFLFPLIAAMLLYILLPHFPKTTETLFSRGIFRVISVPLGWLVSWLPLSLTELAVFVGIGFVLVSIVILIIKLIRRSDRVIVLGRVGRFCGWVLGAAALMYMLCHGANFYRLPAAQLMELPTGTVSPERLQEICLDLAEKANAARLEVAEDENGRMALSKTVSATLRDAGGGYRAIDGEYPFLWGAVGRAKPVQLSHYWSYTGITGMYFPFLCEANVNIDQPHSDLPMCASHELAHTRGFAREDECNFFGWLACIHSPSADYRYSGWLDAYVRCTNALSDYDAELAGEVMARASAGVNRDLRGRYEYWQPFFEAFGGKVMQAADDINDAFIQSQGVEEGLLSYDMVVGLIVGYYEKNA